MQFFKNLSIKGKLIACFFALVSVVVGAAGLTLYSTNQLGLCLNKAYDDVMPTLVNASKLRAELLRHRRLLFLHIISTEESRIQAADRELVEVTQSINICLKRAVELTTSPEEAKIISDIDAKLKAYLSVSDQAFALSRKNENEAATKLALGESLDCFNASLAACDDELDLTTKAGEASDIIGGKTISQAYTTCIASIVFSIVASVIACVILARSIAVPLTRLSEVTKAVSVGDLSKTYEYNSSDEVGEMVRSTKAVSSALTSLTSELDRLTKAVIEGDLSQRIDANQFHGAYRNLTLGMNQTIDTFNRPLQATLQVLRRIADRDLTARMEGEYKGAFHEKKNTLNSTLDALNEALSRVAVGAEQVNAASSQIADGSQSLAHGASQQASALAEISSSMEEMSASTKQNADNATVGQSLAGEAKQAVDSGNNAMQTMAESIQKIKESSDATAKIVKTIDDIAFQTNLLALNAAVEAARAGDAGKGFAVVAEEVRNLAQRSAEAAKTTADLIEESVKNSEHGVRITNEMSEILVQINSSSTKVNDIICEIAAASKQQAAGIEQVNKQLGNLDKITQQTAANSEESASAGEELNAQAGALANTVAEFRLTYSPGTERPASRSTSTATLTKPEGKRKAKSQPRSESIGSGNKVLVPLDDTDFSGF